MKRKQMNYLVVCTLAFSLALGNMAYAASEWVQENGNWYYTDSSGYATKAQMKTIGSQKYAFDENGVMVCNSWYQNEKDNKWYYMGSDGIAKTGWLEIGSEWYYLLPSGAMEADDWRTIDGKKYYFKENGMMQKNGYVGEKYLDSDGVNDSRYDIKVRGKVDKEVLEEAGDNTINIPGWLLDDIFKSGWKIACNAEREDYGTITHEDYDDYIRYYELETGRDLIFFTDPEYIVQGIGMYVDYVFNRPGSSEDFQGAFSVDWNVVSEMFEQLPIIEREKSMTFAEVFALYYNVDDEVRQEFREYCPSLCDYMDRFMAECQVKAQEKQ